MVPALADLPAWRRELVNALGESECVPCLCVRLRRQLSRAAVSLAGASCASPPGLWRCPAAGWPQPGPGLPPASAGPIAATKKLGGQALVG